MEYNGYISSIIFHYCISYPMYPLKKSISGIHHTSTRPMLSANEGGWNTPGVRMLSGSQVTEESNWNHSLKWF